jgi:tetratricopeptide (TPR) repeat protein
MRFPSLPETVVKGVDQKPEVSARFNPARLPLFGYGMVLYGLGLLISAWFAHGNGVRVFWLVVSFLLFWVIWGIGRKTTYLYYLMLGFCTFLMLVGWICAGNLDDGYLRSNFISDQILRFDSQFSPHLEGLKMHRNTLAGMLAVFGVLALNYGLFASRSWVRWVGRFNCLSMFGLLLATNSRGGLIAFITGSVLLIALTWAGNSKISFRFIIIWGVILLTVTGLYLGASGQYQLFTPERLLNENGTSRLEIWGNTFYMLGDVPLTGFGPGNFEAVYPFYIDPAAVSGRASQEHAHNIFLQVYGETGLTGFLGIALIFSQLTRLIRRSFLKKELFFASPDPSEKQNARAVLLGQGGLAASVTMFIYGLTEFNPWNEQFTFLFWLPLALVAAAHTRNRPGRLFISPARVTRWYKAGSRPAKLAVTSGGVILSGLLLWQSGGFATVNMAGLAGEQIWLGAGNTSPDSIEKLYRAAENSVGWTGVPRRGEAWVAWLKNDTDRAEQLLRGAINSQPGDRRSLLMLGDLVATTGKQAEAVTFWQRAQAAPLFVDRGRRILDSANDLGSEPYFLEAVEIDPYLWDGYYCLVMLYQRHDRTKDSIALLEKARPYFPGDPRLQDELNSLKPLLNFKYSLNN